MSLWYQQCHSFHFLITSGEGPRLLLYSGVGVTATMLKIAVFVNLCASCISMLELSPLTCRKHKRQRSVDTDTRGIGPNREQDSRAASGVSRSSSFSSTKQLVAGTCRVCICDLQCNPSVPVMTACAAAPQTICCNVCLSDCSPLGQLVFCNNTLPVQCFSYSKLAKSLQQVLVATRSQTTQALGSVYDR